MRRFYGSFLLICWTFACSMEPQSPEGAVILDGSAILKILDQCSRDAPQIGEGSWQPAAADIGAIERAMPAILRKAKPAENWTGFPENWTREYVGIIRNGQHFIYGNMGRKVPDDIAIDKPIMVCDGGPPYFGMEWDVRNKRISHLAFNGSI